MDVTEPYKFIGFGAMDVTKPYKFIGFVSPQTEGGTERRMERGQSKGNGQWMI